MWVEIYMRFSCASDNLSSSSWGCELKCLCFFTAPRFISVILFVRMWVEMLLEKWMWFWFCVILFVRMWVEILTRFLRMSGNNVILFVRMWVEMLDLGAQHYRTDGSSSSWGCELKWDNRVDRWDGGTVILFVRMWVEITKLIFTNGAKSSSSSWGCELK